MAAGHRRHPRRHAAWLYGRVTGITGATVTFDASSAVSDVASFPEFGRDSVVNSVYMVDFLADAATNTCRGRSTF